MAYDDSELNPAEQAAANQISGRGDENLTPAEAAERAALREAGAVGRDLIEKHNSEEGLNRQDYYEAGRKVAGAGGKSAAKGLFLRYRKKTLLWGSLYIGGPLILLVFLLTAFSGFELSYLLSLYDEEFSTQHNFLSDTRKRIIYNKVYYFRDGKYDGERTKGRLYRLVYDVNNGSMLNRLRDTGNFDFDFDKTNGFYTGRVSSFTVPDYGPDGSVVGTRTIDTADVSSIQGLEEKIAKERNKVRNRQFNNDDIRNRVITREVSKLAARIETETASTGRILATLKRSRLTRALLRRQGLNRMNFVQNNKLSRWVAEKEQAGVSRANRGVTKLIGLQSGVGDQDISLRGRTSGDSGIDSAIEEKRASVDVDPLGDRAPPTPDGPTVRGSVASKASKSLSATAILEHSCELKKLLNIVTVGASLAKTQDLITFANATSAAAEASLTGEIAEDELEDLTQLFRSVDVDGRTLTDSRMVQYARGEADIDVSIDEANYNRFSPQSGFLGTLSSFSGWLENSFFAELRSPTGAHICDYLDDPAYQIGSFLAGTALSILTGGGSVIIQSVISVGSGAFLSLAQSIIVPLITNQLAGITVDPPNMSAFTLGDAYGMGMELDTGLASRANGLHPVTNAQLQENVALIQDWKREENEQKGWAWRWIDKKNHHSLLANLFLDAPKTPAQIHTNSKKVFVSLMQPLSSKTATRITRQFNDFTGGTANALAPNEIARTPSGHPMLSFDPAILDIDPMENIEWMRAQGYTSETAIASDDPAKDLLDEAQGDFKEYLDVCVNTILPNSGSDPVSAFGNRGFEDPLCVGEQKTALAAVGGASSGPSKIMRFRAYLLDNAIITQHFDSLTSNLGVSDNGQGGFSNSDDLPTDVVSPDQTAATYKGTVVHKAILKQTNALYRAADAAGVNLNGSGYRSNARQIELRIKHCGGNTPYNIYQKPSGQCVPPTAIPGKSNHEKGLAIDFTYNGTIIRSHSNPGFVWLKNNASKYGFKNLPSEAWHWSTDGG